MSHINTSYKQNDIRAIGHSIDADVCETEVNSLASNSISRPSRRSATWHSGLQSGRVVNYKQQEESVVMSTVYYTRNTSK